MFVGSVGALQQKKFKRLIAYSSINTTGYYLIFFLLPDYLMLNNVFFFIIFYIINLFGIFFSYLNFFFMKKNIFLEKISLLGYCFKQN
jgi:NADH:ubiquinone oxidoreductase subunit 2 (subunit N)